MNIMALILWFVVFSISDCHKEHLKTNKLNDSPELVDKAANVHHVRNIALKDTNITNQTKVNVSNSTTKEQLSSIGEHSTLSPTHSPITSVTIHPDDPAHNSTKKITNNPTKSPTSTKYPTKNPTSLKPTKSPTVKQEVIIRNVDWTISHDIHQSQNSLSSKESFDDFVQFKSFHCDTIKCECNHFTLNIKIGYIERNFDIDCKPFLQKQKKFHIFPGIGYDFTLLPSVNFLNVKENEEYIINNAKTFHIEQKLSSSISHFELLVVISKNFYDSLNIDDTSELSQILEKDISEVSNIGNIDISISISLHSSNYHDAAKIFIVLGKSANSNFSQILLEKIRNLKYVTDDSSKSTLSNIVSNNLIIKLSSISSSYKSTDNEKPIVIPQDDTSTNKQGTNFGVIILCIIIIVVGCILLFKSPGSGPIKYMLLECCLFIFTVLSKIYIDLVKLIQQSKTRAMSILSPSTNKINYGVIQTLADELDQLESDELESNGISIVKKLLKDQNIALFEQEKYIKTLKDNWLTTEQQIKQLNDNDWERLEFPKNIYQVIQRKLSETNDSQQSHLELSYPNSDKLLQDEETNETGYLSTTSFSDF